MRLNEIKSVNARNQASGISWSLSLPGGIDGGGSEKRIRCRGGTASSLSSTELIPGVLEELSIAVSS